MIYDVNGKELVPEKKVSTPEVRIAPQHKPINPDNLPKRPVEKLPNFLEMNEMERLAMMCSALKLRYDPLRYRSDTSYKARVDSVLMSSMIAFMADYLRKQGHNLEAVFKDGRIEVI